MRIKKLFDKIYKLVRKDKEDIMKKSVAASDFDKTVDEITVKIKDIKELQEVQKRYMEVFYGKGI